MRLILDSLKFAYCKPEEAFEDSPLVYLLPAKPVLVSLLKYIYVILNYQEITKLI